MIIRGLLFYFILFYFILEGFVHLNAVELGGLLLCMYVLFHTG